MTTFILLTNIFSFILFGLDKLKAKAKKWRISEAALLAFAFFGPFGAYLGMQIFNHKTKHFKFKILVPMFCIINIVILFLIKKGLIQ